MRRTLLSLLLLSTTCHCKHSKIAEDPESESLVQTITDRALEFQAAMKEKEKAYIEGKLEIRDELVNNIDPPSDLVADLISKVEELAEADAAYMEEKESKTAASVYTIDTPTSWISDLSQTAAELADSEAAYLQEKVAEVENVKSELKISDPTEGMNDKELKRYREKVLYDAKKIERNALAAAQAAAKKQLVADSHAAAKADLAAKKKAAADAAKAEAHDAAAISKAATKAAREAAKESKELDDEVKAATKAVEDAEAALASA